MFASARRANTRLSAREAPEARAFQVRSSESLIISLQTVQWAANLFSSLAISNSKKAILAGSATPRRDLVIRADGDVTRRSRIIVNGG